MKIGIIGNNGMLGRDINALLVSKGFNIKTFARLDYDITREDDIIKIVDCVDIIINCAAYTKVDQAESEEELCYAVNAEAVGKLGKYAAKAGKYIIHFSTDFVFGDDSNKPLNEKSPTNPLNVYGKTKLTGEHLLQLSEAKHAIIRVEWTYSKNKENFATKILKLADKLDELKVADDQFGAPTSTEDIAPAVLPFIENKIEGLFHFAAEGYASRCEIACTVFDILKIKKKIIPCPSSTFPTPAKRPLNSRFDCRKIDKILKFKRPSWQNALREYLETFKMENIKYDN